MALAKSQRSLKSWTKQKWRTKVSKPSSKTGERYLPTAQSKLYHPKVPRQLELKEKARRKENNLLNNLKTSLRKREVIEKLHNVGYFE